MENETEKKPYPKIKNAIFLCLLFLVIQFVTGLIIGFLFAILRISNESFAYGISIILLDILSFGVVILIGYKKSKQKFNEVFKFNKVSLDYWLAIIVFMIGFVIVSSEIDNIINYFLPMPGLLQNMFETVMVKQMFAVSIILVGIIPAFAEEMFFRGVILNGFTRNYSNIKSILISALFFGIIHLNPWQAVTAFIIGIVLAWVYINTKSIILCIYIHFFNNTASVVTLKFRDVFPIKGFNSAYSEKLFQPLWFDLTGIAITGLGILLLIRAFEKDRQQANVIQNKT